MNVKYIFSYIKHPNMHQALYTVVNYISSFNPFSDSESYNYWLHFTPWGTQKSEVTHLRSLHSEDVRLELKLKLHSARVLQEFQIMQVPKLGNLG